MVVRVDRDRVKVKIIARQIAYDARLRWRFHECHGHGVLGHHRLARARRGAHQDRAAGVDGGDGLELEAVEGWPEGEAAAAATAAPAAEAAKPAETKAEDKGGKKEPASDDKKKK